MVHRAHVFFPGMAICGAKARDGARIVYSNSRTTAPCCVALIKRNQAAAKARAAAAGVL